MRCRGGRAQGKTISSSPWARVGNRVKREELRDATLAWCLRKPSPDALEGGSSLQESLQSLSSNLGSSDHCYHVGELRTEDAVVRDPGRERHTGPQLPEPVARTHSINGASLNPLPQALGMREMERFLKAPCKGRERVESKGLLHRRAPLSTLSVFQGDNGSVGWARQPSPGQGHRHSGTIPSKGQCPSRGGGEEVTPPTQQSSGRPLGHIAPIKRHKELRFWDPAYQLEGYI